MEMYVQWVVIFGFLVNFLLLYGSNRLFGCADGLKGPALAAAVGGVYAGVCLMPSFQFLGNGFWHLVFLGIMIVLAYGIRKSALQRGILFFLLRMALGGIASGLGTQSIWTLVLAGAGLWLLVLLGFGGAQMGRSYVSVTILYGDRQVHITALVDTGNTLKDPVTGKAVLVVDGQVAQRLLGLTEQQLKHPLETMVSGAVPGLRLIPYHAIGQPFGILLAIKADRVVIDGKHKEVVVAFAPQSIGRGKPFEALAGGTI